MTHAPDDTANIPWATVSRLLEKNRSGKLLTVPYGTHKHMPSPVCSTAWGAADHGRGIQETVHSSLRYIHAINADKLTMNGFSGACFHHISYRYYTWACVYHHGCISDAVSSATNNFSVLTCLEPQQVSSRLTSTLFLLTLNYRSAPLFWANCRLCTMALWRKELCDKPMGGVEYSRT